MIIEITTYKPTAGVTDDDLMRGSNASGKKYRARCKGLIRCHFLKNEEGYTDIFLWESKENFEHVQATIIQDSDALEYGKHLDPKSLTIISYERLGTYSQTKEG